MTSPSAGPSSGAGTAAAWSRLKAVCLDCAHPHALARWWAPVLGYTLRPYTDDDMEELRAQGLSGPEEDPAVALDPPDGAGPTVWFNQVPEPKTVKDRVHLDVYGDWADIVARGAILLRPPGEVEGEDWVILADPEGHEFCVFPPR